MLRFTILARLTSRRLCCTQDLKSVMKELLIEFRRFNRDMKPERLIFYRDGVSEGQFETVQRLEIPQACC